MDFDYKKLGTALAWHRTHNNLRQIDLELKSNYRLKQSAISAAERGETRLAVDTLVECTPDAKIMILQIISILKENFMRIEQENQDLKAFYHKYED